LNFNGAGALKTRLIALLAILAASPALAIDHWAETAHILTGVEILSVDDDAILVSKESKPQVEACGLIFVSEAGQVRVEAEDKDRKQLEVTQRTTSEDEPRQWIIHATGRVWVRIELIDFAAQKWDVEKFDYLIEGTTPPDDDDDDPPPPEPEDESPFPGEGLRVLIVYELDELASYPSSQVNVLYSKELRVWAQQNCVKDSTGTAGLRILDQDTTADTPTQWTTAMARPRDSMPWLIVGNGKTGYEGPLPQTLAETISLLEKFK
jgi:hypothetical protein